MRRQDRDLVIQNQLIYKYYKERIVNMALAQFEWNNMPDTCDRLYFERRLLFDGTAAFVQPIGTDFWLSVGYLNQGRGFDVYGYPYKIAGIGYNAKQIPTENWKVLYDNMTRTTLMPHIDMFAKLLWEIHMTFRSNLKHQNTPYIVATNKNESMSFKNLFNRIFGFEPVIDVKDTLDIKSNVQVLDLKQDFKGKEILETLRATWNEALNMLGITGETTKKERMLDNELVLNRQAPLISLNARLLNRTDFCNRMNKAYGLNLSVNLSSESTQLLSYGMEMEKYYGEVHNSDNGQTNGGGTGSAGESE